MKVLIVGDSPRLKTGFARVNRQAAKAFLDAGWEVAAVQGLTSEEPSPQEDDGIKYFTPGPGDDMLGRKTAFLAYSDFKPDAVYNTGDPGSFVAYASSLPQDSVLVGYVPIEGEPIPNQVWRAALSGLDVFTCSKYGTDVVRNELGREIDYVYHGVDHDVFKPNQIREQTRESIGWKDKFVIMCVANNVRRKQIPRLIEAVSILRKKYNRKDVVLYLHTVPFQNHWLEGHNLMEIAWMYGIADIVQFSSKMNKLHGGIEETTGDPKSPGLVELYNAADLFVLPSQVEGFGLPIAEAMACGLPVLVTKYAAGWEVASPAGRGIPVIDWEIHKSGTKYANVSPEGMADEINRLIRNPNERKRMSEAGIERAKDYDWRNFAKVVVEQVEKAVNAHKASRLSKEEKNQGTEPEGSKEIGI